MALNWTLIDLLAQNHSVIDPSISEKALLRKLKTWWSIKYNRPFKDPLLGEYTLDELVYEYLVHYYLDPKNDIKKKQEQEAVEQADEDWIKKQLKEHQKKKKPKKNKEPEKPPEPPPDIDAPELSTRFDE